MRPVGSAHRSLAGKGDWPLGESAPPTSREAVLLLAALAIGTLVRVGLYLRGSSLWIDEARLALNVGARSYRELLAPLDYDQVAPPLFLWALKAATQVAGMNEYALRAIPLAAAIAVPFLLVPVSVSLGGWRVASFAAVLAALSPGLVAHAAEAKPYAVDAFVCLGLIALHLANRRRGGSGLGAWVIAAGAVAVWLSAPAVFVLAAIGSAGFIGATAVERRGALAAFAAWAISFGSAYLASYGASSSNAYLREVWSGGFLTPFEPGGVMRAAHTARDVLCESFAIGVIDVSNHSGAAVGFNVVAVVLAILLAVGVRAMMREAGSTGVRLACGPWMFVVAASLAALYPLAPRLTTFGVPLLIVLLALALVSLERLPVPLRVTGVGAFGVIFVAGALWCIDQVAARGEHVRPAVQFFQRESLPGESVYVLARAVPAWTFYTTDWTNPDTTRLARMAQAGSAGGPAFENAASRGRPLRRPVEGLRFSHDARVELIGAFHGDQWRPGDLGPAGTDPNWAAAEALRVRKEGRPHVWVLLVRARGVERQLQAALSALGARPGTVFEAEDVILVRYAFADAAATSTASP
ncbi:MAG TPA: hypothetical protein VFM14_10850 [Gemmatimonadales bacterium]|nr:hypothetical protein [Gemmatimonadales bacterium]